MRKRPAFSETELAKEIKGYKWPGARRKTIEIFSIEFTKPRPIFDKEFLEQILQAAQRTDAKRPRLYSSLVKTNCTWWLKPYKNTLIIAIAKMRYTQCDPEQYFKLWENRSGNIYDASSSIFSLVMRQKMIAALSTEGSNQTVEMQSLISIATDIVYRRLTSLLGALCCCHWDSATISFNFPPLGEAVNKNTEGLALTMC